VGSGVSFTGVFISLYLSEKNIELLALLPNYSLHFSI
jgi:hypothetical protein